ncbi:mucin-16-like [Scyliorhinus torazame]|uniref:mucin-16-like n=1 Tax=Scyliorhinus torazame TaxID=75743 RepID=UPI003B58F1F7
METSTVAQTSTPAPPSSSTLAPTTTAASPEASTTMTTSLLSTSQTSTLSGRETPSTSIQTSTSSAVPVTISEAFTTRTTSLMTVEPPIVPATVNPNQGTQAKEFNVTFTVLTLSFTSSLQNLSSPLYIANSSKIREELNNLFGNSNVKSKFRTCQSVSFRLASDGSSTVEAICTWSATAQVDKVLLYHEFQNNTQGITTFGPYSLDSNSLFVNGYHESIVLTTTEQSAANIKTSTTAQTVTSAVPSMSTIATTATLSSTEASITTSLTSASGEETSAAATETSTAAQSSTSASISTSTTAQTPTVSTTEGSTTEATAGTTPPPSTSAAESSTTSTQTYTAALTSPSSTPATSETASTSTVGSIEGSTTEESTYTTSLPSTNEPSVSTVSSQTALPTSRSAPTTPSTIAPTSVANSIESSTPEATTMTTPILSTSAAEKTSAAATEISTAAQSSTSASISTIATAETPTVSSTEAPTTEARTGTAPPPSTNAESSTTSTLTTTASLTPSSSSPATSQTASTSTVGSTEGSTAEESTYTTSLPSTSEQSVSTTNTQTSTEAATSRSAPTSPSTLAPTSGASSIESTTPEATTMTTSILSTSATEHFTTNMETSTVAQTSTPAPPSSSTLAPTMTAASPEASTTMTTSLLSTSQTSTPSGRETPSTSIQTQTHSAVPVTTSEAFTTRTTSRMTVEPPIVPVTVNPNQGTQAKEFNVTFTVLTLSFTSSLQNLSSPLYIANSSKLREELNNLFGNSNVKSKFRSCQSVSFRPASDGGSTVETICIWSATAQVDKVLLYHEFQNKTQGITTFGPYSLDSNSLFVNGYHESIILTTAETLTTKTQTSLAEQTSTSTPASTRTIAPTTTLSSTKAVTTKENTIATSPTSTSATTIVASTTEATTTTTLPAISAIETTANTQTPTAAPASTSAPTLTSTVAAMPTATSTNASTTEATSSLPSTSVEPPIVPVTAKPNQGIQAKEFNVTFTVLTLSFTSSLQNLSSLLYTVESRNIREKLNNLYANSKAKSTFSSCQSVSFRPASDGNSTVEAICIFKRNTTVQQVDKVLLYHEFRDNTQGITTLEPYSLDRNSLFVNGYHESAVLTNASISITSAQTSTANIQTSRATLTSTSAPASTSTIPPIATASSSKASTTEATASATSLTPTSVIASTETSSAKIQTSTAAPNSTSAAASMGTIVSTMTVSSTETLTMEVTAITSLTSPTVEPPIVPVTAKPNQGTQAKEFNVTFTVLTLSFTSSLQNLSSLLYMVESRNIREKLNNLYTNSKINATFSSCQSVSFRPASDGNSTVELTCIFKKIANAQQVDRVLLYHEFRDNTEGITTFGTYSLDSNSLFVNGYHESAVLTTKTPFVTTSPNLQTKPFEFNVTFIVTNLALTADLQSPNSELYKSASNVIVHQLNGLFNDSNIKRTFQSCRVRSFGPANIEDISVDAVCTFRNNSIPQEVNKVIVYHVFRDNTKSISTLGTYALDNNSLYVNGYHEPVPSPTIVPLVTTSPNLQTKPFEFNVTFIVTNLALTADLQSSNSELYKSASNVIVHQLNRLFSNSSIKRTFQSCRVRSFGLANVEDTNVDVVCSFRNNSIPHEVNKVTVYHVFRNNTKSISTLGTYTLDNNSLYVNDYHEPVPSTTLVPLVTTSPNLQTKPFEFNVTFTVTNLALTADLQSPNSDLYKSASSIIALQLNRLFSNSSIKRTFQSCRVRSFGLENVDDTSVDAVCTFRNNSIPQEVNKVTVYHVFRDNTKSISTLGTYALDNNSLYVNGYHESVPSTTPLVTTSPNLQAKPFEFNVTFTVTNLALTADLQSSNSDLSKSASKIIVYQLNRLFSSSNIKRTFQSCSVRSFGLANVDDTSVDAVCTFRNNSIPQEVNKVTVYHVFRDNTKSISTLGTYALDNNSLYVNGYHEPVPSTTPLVTTSPNLQAKPFEFNVTFTVTNLALTADLQSSNSDLSKSASKIIVYQLNRLFSSSNIKRTFQSCRVRSFGLANVDDTSVDAVCTFRNNSIPQEVNKVTVYHVFRDNTKSISTLGTYALDNNSLYVNGYHEPVPSTTPLVTTSPNLQAKPFEFNVTFTVTNLALTADLQSSNSDLSKSASKIIVYLLNRLFSSSNIKRTFQSCRVRSFGLANVDDTSVDAVCTFRNNSIPQEVNKVTVYHVFRDNTKSISTLGTYTLDNNSLYVNGYHEPISSTTISPIGSTIPNVQTNHFEFNVTFIITNLPPTASLQSSSSSLYKSASKVIAYQLKNLFTHSNINRTFSVCRVLSFSLANVGSTKVYAICTFQNDSSAKEVNKVTVYRQIQQHTEGISTLGTYLLDHNSLYVNGYYELTPLPTAPPIVTLNVPAKPFDFNVTFVITNLAPTASLQDFSSSLHKSASFIIAYQLNNLFTKSKIKRTFSNCKVFTFSATKVDSTSVYAVCSFRNDSAPREVNKVTVYHELRDDMKGITTLGTYLLDSNSLYVNAYHEPIPLSTEGPIVIVTQHPNEGTRQTDFNVTFTLSNLTFTTDLQNLNSSPYQSTSRHVINSLNKLYRKSKIKKAFSNCKLASFRPGNRGNTEVETSCAFKNNPTVKGVDAVTVYNEFRDNTEKVTALGSYSLNKNSLYVNGYRESEPTTSPAISLPAVRDGDLSFELNFTIINRNFTEALNDPNSPQYRSIGANITRMLTGLFKKSSLKNSYRIAKVIRLRSGSVDVTSRCYFNPNVASELVTAERVRTEFAAGTSKTSLLGNVYMLRNDSLTVEAKEPVSASKIEIPYWGIILIVLGVLLVLLLLFLLGLLIAFCLKRKNHASYDVMQNPSGFYFLHQKFY